MPEGDTVWNTARALHRALHGQVLTGSDLRVPRLATVDLTGWRVLESTCRGKHLLLRLAESGTDRPMTLHSHLRMDGAWRVFRPGDSPGKPAGMGPGRRSSAWRGGPAHTIRAVLYTGAATAVGFHLHDLALVPTADEPSLVGHLGPDLLGPDWDPDEAARRLAAHPDTPIAQALLDQTNLAGIGNLYKSELLFLRGVSPWTPVRDVPDLHGMAALAHRLLTANAGRWTQSTTGSLRRSETTYVYGRRAQPCRRCGTLIEKAEQGERVTYWCPTCQPARPV